jgi:hypothetical protein
MYRVIVALLFVIALAACGPEEKTGNQTYLALCKETESEYFQSAERAYRAQMRFAEHVRDSIRLGVPFPDEKVLVWVYPRIGLAAEYLGRKEEAAHIFAFAEEFRKRLYPGEPVDRTGKFPTLRDAVLYMDRNAKVPWLVQREWSHE